MFVVHDVEDGLGARAAAGGNPSGPRPHAPRWPGARRLDRRSAISPPSKCEGMRPEHEVGVGDRRLLAAGAIARGPGQAAAPRFLGTDRQRPRPR